MKVGADMSGYNVQMHSPGGITCVEADPHFLALSSAAFLDIQWFGKIYSSVGEWGLFTHSEGRQRWWWSTAYYQIFGTGYICV